MLAPRETERLLPNGSVFVVGPWSASAWSRARAGARPAIFILFFNFVKTTNNVPLYDYGVSYFFLFAVNVGARGAFVSFCVQKLQGLAEKMLVGSG